jgi:hypothetical protein
VTDSDDEVRAAKERLAARLQAAQDDPASPDNTLSRLLAMGVPYPLAVEAIASTALDRDQGDGGAHTRRARTHEVTDQPAWLREDPDGYRIVDRD